MKKKYILLSGLVIGVICMIAGVTYAWLSANYRYDVGDTTGCFEIFYIKGNNIGSDQNKATLMPSTSYTGGLSSTVKMGTNNRCKTTGTGKIYLNTLSTTSSNLYREGLLNYQILKNGIETNLKGSITGPGSIEIDLGSLSKVASVNDAPSYQIYVWVDYNLVENEDAFSNYYGNITAKAVQE